MDGATGPVPAYFLHHSHARAILHTPWLALLLRQAEAEVDMLNEEAAKRAAVSEYSPAPAPNPTTLGSDRALTNLVEKAAHAGQSPSRGTSLGSNTGRTGPTRRPSAVGALGVGPAPGSSAAALPRTGPTRRRVSSVLQGSPLLQPSDSISVSADETAAPSVAALMPRVGGMGATGSRSAQQSSVNSDSESELRQSGPSVVQSASSASASSHGHSGRSSKSSSDVRRKRQQHAQRASNGALSVAASRVTTTSGRLMASASLLSGAAPAVSAGRSVGTGTGTSEARGPRAAITARAAAAQQADLAQLALLQRAGSRTPMLAVTLTMAPQESGDTSAGKAAQAETEAKRAALEAYAKAVAAAEAEGAPLPPPPAFALKQTSSSYTRVFARGLSVVYFRRWLDELLKCVAALQAPLQQEHVWTASSLPRPPSFDLTHTDLQDCKVVVPPSSAERDRAIVVRLKAATARNQLVYTTGQINSPVTGSSVVSQQPRHQQQRQQQRVPSLQLQPVRGHRPRSLSYSTSNALTSTAAATAGSSGQPYQQPQQQHQQLLQLPVERMAVDVSGLEVVLFESAACASRGPLLSVSVTGRSEGALPFVNDFAPITDPTDLLVRHWAAAAAGRKQQPGLEDLDVSDLDGGLSARGPSHNKGHARRLSSLPSAASSTGSALQPIATASALAGPSYRLLADDDDRLTRIVRAQRSMVVTDSPIGPAARVLARTQTAMDVSFSGQLEMSAGAAQAAVLQAIVQANAREPSVLLHMPPEVRVETALTFNLMAAGLKVATQETVVTEAPAAPPALFARPYSCEPPQSSDDAAATVAAAVSVPTRRRTRLPLIYDAAALEHLTATLAATAAEGSAGVSAGALDGLHALSRLITSQLMREEDAATAAALSRYFAAVAASVEASRSRLLGMEEDILTRDANSGLMAELLSALASENASLKEHMSGLLALEEEVMNHAASPRLEDEEEGEEADTNGAGAPQPTNTGGSAILLAPSSPPHPPPSGAVDGDTGGSSDGGAGASAAAADGAKHEIHRNTSAAAASTRSKAQIARHPEEVHNPWPPVLHLLALLLAAACGFLAARWAVHPTYN